MSKACWILPLIIGINFPNLASASDLNQPQMVQVSEQANVERFWNWYQKLDERDRASARAFIKEFLLNERTLSEDLKPFSDRKAQAITLSNFLEQAERSPQMEEILKCVASEGGSGCAP